MSTIADPISVTDAAARKIAELGAKQGHAEPILRLRVVAGGCSGFSYELGFDEHTAPDDHVIRAAGRRAGRRRPAERADRRGLDPRVRHRHAGRRPQGPQPARGARMRLRRLFLGLSVDHRTDSRAVSCRHAQGEHDAVARALSRGRHVGPVHRLHRMHRRLSLPRARLRGQLPGPAPGGRARRLHPRRQGLLAVHAGLPALPRVGIRDRPDDVRSAARAGGADRPVPGDLPRAGGRPRSR